MFFICIDSSDNKVRSPMERPLFFSLPHRAKIKCKTFLLCLFKLRFIYIRNCHITINCLKIQVKKKYFRISKFFCKETLCYKLMHLLTSWQIFACFTFILLTFLTFMKRTYVNARKCIQLCIHDTCYFAKFWKCRNI